MLSAQAGPARWWGMIFPASTLVLSGWPLNARGAHHAEGLVNPKVRGLKIENRSPQLPLPTFSKTWFFVHKKWLKLVKIGQNWQFFKTFCGYFYVFQVVEHIRDILRTHTVKNETFSKKMNQFNFFQFLLILATFYEQKITFWKKLVEVAAGTYFQFDIFGIYMLWGI
jgi:hypothetical protein